MPKKAPRPPIGTRVLVEQKEQIEAIAAEQGISVSDWLYQLVCEGLGQDADTVRSLNQRVEMLEKKLMSLAR